MAEVPKSVAKASGAKSAKPSTVAAKPGERVAVPVNREASPEVPATAADVSLAPIPIEAGVLQATPVMADGAPMLVMLGFGGAAGRAAATGEPLTASASPAVSALAMAAPSLSTPAPAAEEVIEPPLEVESPVTVERSDAVVMTSPPVSSAVPAPTEAVAEAAPALVAEAPAKAAVTDPLEGSDESPVGSPPASLPAPGAGGTGRVVLAGDPEPVSKATVQDGVPTAHSAAGAGRVIPASAVESSQEPPFAPDPPVSNEAPAAAAPPLLRKAPKKMAAGLAADELAPKPPVKSGASFEVPAAAGDLLIAANAQTDFQVDQRRIVFTGNVVMKNERFYLTAEKLVAYMKDKEQGLDFAEAQGDVVVRLVENGRETGSSGLSKTAVFHPKTGEIVLKGWPQLRFGNKAHVASSATTEMSLFTDGRMKTSGRNQTMIVP